MDTKIKKLLDSNKIKYKLVEHKKVYTAFTGAQTQHIDPKTVVKTVLVKISKPLTHLQSGGKIKPAEFILVAVPAKNRVDFKKIAKAINEHMAKSYKIAVKEFPKLKKPAVITIKMAGEKDITKKLKTKVGLLHPFTQIFDLPPLLIDKKLTKNKKLIVPAGSYVESLEISTKDFLKISSGVEGNFTE
jgi:prolyl-tRNA editing enzyme YbaK/EbsC (Cys-tRNA(Pro) deacylase)